MQETPNLHLKKPDMSDKISDYIKSEQSNLDIIDMFMPVGHIIFNDNEDFNPNEQFPGTTWTQIHNVFLVASGNEFAPGSTGGAKNHSHLIPIGFDQDNLYGYYTTTSSWNIPAYGSVVQKESTLTWKPDETPVEAGMQRIAYTQRVEALPPYRSTNMWVRTA